MANGNSDWANSKQIARAVLHDRAARRKIIMWMLAVALLSMAAGLWLVDRWLAENPWFFLLWWGACGVITCGVVICALYDALAVIREERNRHQ